MEPLILLIFDDSEYMRCRDMAEALSVAKSKCGTAERILVEVTPARPGPMTTLEFDRESGDWRPSE
jgi:hypothetical protein